MDWIHTIGIVGGLGPLAHIELERLLLAETRDRLGAALKDQDYPSWILVSMTETPDRTRALIGEGASPLPCLEQAVARLAASTPGPGASFALIACGTAHAYLDELRARSSIPIFDMIEEALVVAAQSSRVIGLLATTGTLRARLYQQRAERLDPALQVITPLDLPGGEELQERLVMTPIYGSLQDGERAGGGIKSGSPTSGPKQALARATRLLGQTADLVICGCTEIPLVLGRDAIDGIPLLDPMQVMAHAAISLALGERPLPQGWLGPAEE